MNQRLVALVLAGIVLATLVFASPLFAASASHKAVFTFGGLNERSGILWVARDAGIFQKHGIDATIVIVRNAGVRAMGAQPRARQYPVSGGHTR